MAMGYIGVMCASTPGVDLTTSEPWQSSVVR